MRDRGRESGKRKEEIEGETDKGKRKKEREGERERE